MEKLTPEEHHVIVEKGTERPFSGEYNQFFEEGVYVCKRCKAPLYRSSDKFDGHCGWPAFDDEIAGAVKKIPDADGRRIEIVCNNCGAHLGHVFKGEGFTDKNLRHCVNSVSMSFIPADSLTDRQREKYGLPPRNEQTAVFASGCFWGTEYWFAKQKGVLSTQVGYAGGKVVNPSYNQVSSGATGHAEAVKIVFDPTVISYDELVRLFFETHDPTQVNRQGPDIGTQYRSVVFYTDEQQKQTAQKYIGQLKNKGYDVATSVEALDAFYPESQAYHQKYYQKTGKTPYCHFYQPKF